MTREGAPVQLGQRKALRQDEDMTVVDQMFTAIDRAEAQALAAHEAGTCQASEFSCSYCERATR